MKKKVALFFHLEKDDEKAAYEVLESLGRKKSAAITQLVLLHKDELESLKAKPRCHNQIERQQIKTESMPRPKRDEVDLTEPVHVEPPDEPKSIKQDSVENVTGKEEKALDKNLILQGLQSFGL